MLDSKLPSIPEGAVNGGHVDGKTYHIPFDVYIEGLRELGYSPEALSFITDVEIERLRTILALPIEHTEIKAFEQIPFDELFDSPDEKMKLPVELNDEQVKRVTDWQERTGNSPKDIPVTTADDYYREWLFEDTYNAVRFQSICDSLIRNDFSSDPLEYVRGRIEFWRTGFLRFSAETLSKIFGVSVEELDSFTRDPESVPAKTQLRIVASALRFGEAISLFMTKAVPRVEIPWKQ